MRNRFKYDARTREDWLDAILRHLAAWLIVIAGFLGLVILGSQLEHYLARVFS